MQIKMRKLTTLFIMCYLVLVMGVPNYKVKAANEVIPTPHDNLQISLRKKSWLVATASGYMRVFLNDKKINIEYYDDDFNIQSKRSLDMELDYWGGFYAGVDAYYVVVAQANEAENDTAEVIRVIKYDTNWNKLGTAKITSNPELFGGEVRYPFDHGCVEMTEHDGTLYIVTGHEGYVDSAYGQGHQGFLMIAVDETTMTGKIVACDLWHSFAQYIDHKGNELYVLEQSEGSRATKVTQYNSDSFASTSVLVFGYGGIRDSAWSIPCYASVDGMALSSANMLCIGTSIDQSQYDNVAEDTPHNIYLTVTPMDDFSKDKSTVKWLTNYTSGGTSFYGVRITKVNDNRFMISWEVFGTEQEGSVDDCLSTSILHYVFVDGNGNVISQEFTAPAPISECQPIIKGGNIVYYASNSNMVNFYTIDSQTGAFSKRVHRIAGDSATWEIVDGTMIISGTGEIRVDINTHFRYPISSTATWYSYSENDGAWKSVKDDVKKLIIKTGIESISEYIFTDFDNMKEVVIESGLRSIGECAFLSCHILEKITIPASVNSIGEDILWTGGYRGGSLAHVTKAVIYAPYGSRAIEYAKNNDISFVADITDAKISGIKTSYVYTGKAIVPKLVVKIGKATLEQGEDYKIVCTNNKKTGKATVKVVGINGCRGTIVKHFKIVPKKAVILKLVSPKTGNLQVTWKKDSQANGYQIQYAKNKKFTSGKQTVTITKNTITSKKLKKCTRRRTYYVRVRSYKMIDGKKCYGSWSKIKSVKCK